MATAPLGIDLFGVNRDVMRGTIRQHETRRVQGRLLSEGIETFVLHADRAVDRWQERFSPNRMGPGSEARDTAARGRCVAGASAIRNRYQGLMDPMVMREHSWARAAVAGSQRAAQE
jgi:hypothetical protein